MTDRVERTERGSTAVELVVASALTLLLLSLALPIVLTAHRATARSLAEGRLHGDARAVVTEVVRRLRSARPPAVCTDPPGAAMASCRRIGPRLATLLQAEPDRVCFAVTPNARAAEVEATALVAPELVCLGRRAGTSEVAVTTWLPRAVDDCEAGQPRPTSYTTPCWDHARPRTERIIGSLLPGAPSPFRYRAATGDLLPAPGPAVLDAATDDQVLAEACVAPCIARDLAAVARIEVDLRLGYLERRRPRELRLRLDVVPRGASLGSLQTWAVG